jgi:hypothetical protein
VLGVLQMKGEVKRIPKNDEESKRILDILRHNKYVH